MVSILEKAHSIVSVKPAGSAGRATGVDRREDGAYHAMRLESKAVEVIGDSEAESEIVLAIAQAIRDRGHEVLGLQGTNKDVRSHANIDSRAGRQSKVSLRPGGLDSRAGQEAPEKRVREGRETAAAHGIPGTKQVRERIAASWAGDAIAGDVAHEAEPAAKVVFQLHVDRAQAVGLGGRLALDIGVAVEAEVIVAAVSFEFRRLPPLSCALRGAAPRAINTASTAASFIILLNAPPGVLKPDPLPICPCRCRP